MANTSARMLRLLSLLQTHRYWPGPDLAGRLDVSERTLRRDIDRLRDLGYPVDASRGVAGGYQLQSGAAMPPLLLDDEEAVAIAVGLRFAAGGSVADIEDISVRALTKIIQVMPPRLRRRVDALQQYTVPSVVSGGPTVDASALTAIAQACRDDERLRFGYTRRDGEQSARHVEPNRLVSIGRRWYLVCFDVERGDWRSFRVDRMVEPTPTGVRFRQRDLPGGDAAAFVRGGLQSIPTRHHVVVNVAATAEKVAATVGQWGTVRPLDDGRAELVMNVDTLDWPAFVLLSIGAEFDVVEPTELTDYIRGAGTFLTRSVS